MKLKLIVLALICTMQVSGCVKNKQDNLVYKNSYTDNQSTENIFRNASWGMTKQDIKTTEDAKCTVEQDKFLFYESTSLGYDCMFGYSFDDEGFLTTIDVGFLIPSSEEARQLFGALSSTLKSKYPENARENPNYHLFVNNNTSVHLTNKYDKEGSVFLHYMKAEDFWKAFSNLQKSEKIEEQNIKKDLSQF